MTKYNIDENDLVCYPFKISYTDQNKKRYYTLDFLFRKLNLVIEIKSCYTLKLDTTIELKKKAILEKGYKYLLIVDNQFEEFDDIMKENF